MTGFDEVYEMIRGRRDALNGVPLSEHESEPYRLSWLHWDAIKRRKATRVSVPFAMMPKSNQGAR